VLILTFEDDGEMHPTELVTIYVYEPGGRPEMEIVVPLPEVVTLPGLRVNVQVPVAGNPLNATLPVATEHVGWVIVPTTGAAGVCKIVTEVAAVVIPQPPEAAIEYLTEYVPAVLVAGVIVPVEGLIDKPAGFDE
jgi:hypothetical protein